MLEEIKNRLARHQPESLPHFHRDRARAAVLIPLLDRGAEPHVLLTERAGALSSHGGEVAFPGGKEDETDDSLVWTALRENEEELGIAPDSVEILGQLKPFVSKYGLMVTPFVGLVDERVTLSPNPDEIASVFEVPLTFFERTSPARIDQVARHGEAYAVRVFEYDGYEIWGLTALIVDEFLNIGLR
ncbi:MAG: CoA pyrophosphatase [Pseudomonadales bacterium]|nr:CoA pyrophosphatase [Pseudomonadales bacterium]